jgi:amino acid adenylation domain-containing protein
VLLTHRDFDARIPPPVGGRVFRLDADWPALRSMPTTNPEPTATPRDLAYVIYTSGSTGKPKGVQVEHRGLVNFLSFAAAQVGIGPGDVVALEATYCFDIFAFECWGALSAGATAVIIRDEALLSPDTLREVIVDAGVTVLRLPASLLVRYLRTHPDLVSGVRSVCYGGEVVERAVLDALQSGPYAPGRLIHWYGPTEATVISTWHPVGKNPSPRQRMPIGRAIPNTRLYVVDTHGEPVPTCVPGELWIGGIGVARGYHNRPDLTAERFIRDPFVDDPAARVYRTGDVVRRLPGGDLEFLHRVDHQVKLRGFRIEPGEVEAVILSDDHVAACVVVTREDAEGEQHLVAYCVPTGRAPDTTKLRQLCAGLLPNYMVPHRIVVVDALPVTGTGKIDRSALPDVDQTASDRCLVAPGGPIESAVAAVLFEVLGRQPLDAQDDFLHGGRSLVARSPRGDRYPFGDRCAPTAEGLHPNTNDRRNSRTRQPAPVRRARGSMSLAAPRPNSADDAGNTRTRCP